MNRLIYIVHEIALGRMSKYFVEEHLILFEHVRPIPGQEPKQLMFHAVVLQAKATVAVFWPVNQFHFCRLVGTYSDITCPVFRHVFVSVLVKLATTVTSQMT